MTSIQINKAIENGTQITICPFDVWTNQASATVLSVGDGRIAYYQVDGCEAKVSRQVSFSTWNSIINQAGR